MEPGPWTFSSYIVAAPCLSRRRRAAQRLPAAGLPRRSRKGAELPRPDPDLRDKAN